MPTTVKCSATLPVQMRGIFLGEGKLPGRQTFSRTQAEILQAGVKYNFLCKEIYSGQLLATGIFAHCPSDDFRHYFQEISFKSLEI